MNAAPTRPSNKRQRQGAQEDPKEKPCKHSSGHIFDSIIIKLASECLSR
jgi:hypothetical protein